MSNGTSNPSSNSEELFPPLPDSIAPRPGVSEETAGDLTADAPGAAPPIRRRSLRCGCYLVNYTPHGNPLVTYDGTIRVECHSNGRTASGDLYQRRVLFLPPPHHPLPPHERPRIILAPPPNPAAGIPIFARDRYRFYLRITQILESVTIRNDFTLGFEMHRFDRVNVTWNNEGAFTALMHWLPAPPGYPSAGDYLAGDVKNGAGVHVGRLKMGWLSQYLRKATIEIDRVAQAEATLNNGAGIGWRNVGDGVGWDITVDSSDSDVAEPSGESWSNAECHQAMLARRDLSNLDAEWRYHILCVRRLNATPRGIMYDNSSTDSNNIPREGCAISSHWIIPDTPEWGLVRGQRFGAAPLPYYRTAVHETGHAMGLYHNTVDLGFMNTTDVIAAEGTAANPFPNNVQWSFAPDDQKRLRHMPDIHVRPGGTPFGASYATTPISPTDELVEDVGLRLSVQPLIPAVPLGAPVRVDISLTNTTGAELEVPASLSLKSGFVRGQVTDPSGTVRTFSPLVLCVDDLPLRLLAPGASVNDSLTLLRGGQGALFPMPGIHSIQVEVNWDVAGMEIVAAGQGDVMITGAMDDAHAQTALKLLSTPDTLLALVLGGDHIEDGIDAIHAALKNPVLRPHFAYIESKRIAEKFGKRKADLKGAAELIKDDTVMSSAEIKKSAESAKSARDKTSATALAKTLKKKLAKQPAGADTKKLVDSL